MGAGLTGRLAYPSPLIEATYLKRYKRFFADVQLADGTVVTSHCANTGSMAGVNVPGAPCRVAFVDDPKRKLKWTLEQICIDGTWVMVHTARPNRVVEEAVRAGEIGPLAGFETVRREVRISEHSRADLALLDGGFLAPGEPPPKRAKGPLTEATHVCWVEVKNVTRVIDGVASFPDAVSSRGAKHMAELAERVRRGERAALVLHIARDDAHVFAPADDIDPVWGDAYRAAREVGVEVFAAVCDVQADSLGLKGHIEAKLSL